MNIQIGSVRAVNYSCYPGGIALLSNFTVKIAFYKCEVGMFHNGQSYKVTLPLVTLINQSQCMVVGSTPNEKAEMSVSRSTPGTSICTTPRNN